jgi:hypothetical protein
MNNTRSLWCLGAIPNRPLSDFVYTGGEETTQVQDLTHGGDNLRESGLDAEGLELGLDFVLGLEAREAFLEADGDGHDGVAGCVLLNPFHDFAEMLVLLSDVVFLAQVDEVDDWLGCQEEKRVDELDLS